MLGPQDERTLMLNAKTTYTKTTLKDLANSTFARDGRTVNNRTYIDKEFGCKYLLFSQLPPLHNPNIFIDEPEYKIGPNQLPKKFEKELVHLKNINDRLSKELKKCQYVMGMEAPSLEDIYLGQQDKSEEFEELLNIMNSSYYMSPLLMAYDDHFYNVEKELKSAHIEISRLHENMRQLEQEN